MSKFPILTHYSHEHVTSVRPIQPQRADAGPKPRGFWVSVDEGGRGWADFCQADDWNLHGLEYVHDVRLREGANLLILTSAWDLDGFTEAFGVPYPKPGPWASTYILWHRVAALYSGILIAPYVYARRLDGKASDWYHGWDCASGCIWDVGTIESITLRERVEVAA